MLIDDAEVRAVMTASWLRQMGWRDVFVLAETGHETGSPKPPMLARGTAAADMIEMHRTRRTVGGRYGHGGRSFAEPRLSKRPHPRRMVCDPRAAGASVLADRAAWTRGPDIGRRRARRPSLAGSSRARRKSLCAPFRAVMPPGQAGLEMSADARMADEPLDVWLKPYERSGDTAGAMSEYLSWETDLVERIARDGSCNFTNAPP